MSKKLVLLKILTQEKITQTSSEHSKRFSALNECKIIKTQKTPSLSIVNKFSDLH